ncbi:MAG: alpha/beta superfamily hydrolase [Cellvibrionaceae bacterium]|jgi:alpha/beta superfamily hydrolase
MATKKVLFTNSNNEKIGARLDSPDGVVKAYALFAHCFTCHKNLNAIRNISHALTAAGIAVLRFDFTGLGESEGDFADTNFSSNVDDLVAAAQFLAAEFEAPKLIIGHSLGGAAVLMAASRLPNVQAIATIGAPCDPEHVTHMIQCSIDEIEANGYADVLLAGRPFTIKKQFLDDLAAQNMTAIIRSLKRPLLVCHSPIDNTVGVDNAGHIFSSALHPKSFLSLGKADHLLTKGADATYAGEMIATWVMPYL